MSEDIKELDLTKRTITLGSDDNPAVTLMKGHVDGKTFDKAWKEEGWDGGLEENPTDEDVKKFEEGIEHGYGIFHKDNKVSWRKEKEDEGAEPITFLMW